MFLAALLFLVAQGQPLLKIDVNDQEDFTRVIIQTSSSLRSSVEQSSDLLLVRLRTTRGFRIQREAFRSRVVDAIGWSQGADYFMLSIKIALSDFSYDAFTTRTPPQLVIDIRPKNQGGEERKPPPEPPRAKTSGTESTGVPRPAQSAGMKTVIIDPGHGGLETGAQGKSGLLEKDVTLAIGLKLKNVIQRNLTFNVVMTREKDIDISLDNRAAVANNNKAYLFISIHANSSYRKDARGSETYFLSMNATDEEARRLAYLENNSQEFEASISSANEYDIVMILWDMAQAAYLKQSSELAESIQRELNAVLGTKNRGIKQAPFKVLTGVACPAVLVEVAFLSYSEEEKKLKDEEFQNRIAQAIYRGLLNYLRANSDG